jgi:hypothetical protein
LEELQVENEALSRKLASLQSTEGAAPTEDAKPVVPPVAPASANAGDAFGGRDSMQRRSGTNA